MYAFYYTGICQLQYCMSSRSVLCWCGHRHLIIVLVFKTYTDADQGHPHHDARRVTRNCLNGNVPFLNSRSRRDRIVVSTSRCGRDNPGSNPGHGRAPLCHGMWVVLLTTTTCRTPIHRSPSIYPSPLFWYWPQSPLSTRPPIKQVACIRAIFQHARLRARFSSPNQLWVPLARGNC